MVAEKKHIAITVTFDQHSLEHGHYYYYYYYYSFVLNSHEERKKHKTRAKTTLRTLENYRARGKKSSSELGQSTDQWVNHMGAHPFLRNSRWDLPTLRRTNTQNAGKIHTTSWRSTFSIPRSEDSDDHLDN